MADLLVTAKTPLAGPAHRWSWWAVVLLLAILVAHGLSTALVMLPREKANDFFCFYVQARVPLTGHSPYESGVIDYEAPMFRDGAREHFRWLGLEGKAPPALEQPFGLFYPPQGYLIFTPFSRLPFNVALTLWTIFLSLLAMACGTLCWTADPDRAGRSPTTIALVIGAILLNPLMQVYFGISQTSLIIAASAALGLWSLRRGRQWLAAFLWAFCAAKPQLGFELYLLAAVAGGWRFFVRVVLATTLLNAVGGWIVSGDPLMILQMYKGGQTHLSSEINKVANYHIVGWNRVLYAMTGRAVEMVPSVILASHVGWMSLLAANAYLRRGLRLPLAYWFAATACGSVMCGLSHHYDLVVLVLLIPYLFWLGDRRQRADLAFLLTLIALISLPATVVRGALARWPVSETATTLLVSYRAFLVVALAAYLIVRLPRLAVDQTRKGVAHPPLTT